MRLTAGDVTLYPLRMANPPITCRIWPDAQAKLFEEMAHYRGDKPPIGQFISRLILMCPPELWNEVRESMDARYEHWEG